MCIQFAYFIVKPALCHLWLGYQISYLIPPCRVSVFIFLMSNKVCNPYNH